jgi:hypothetical protein
MEFTLLTETSTKASAEVFTPTEGQHPAPPQATRIEWFFVSHSSARIWRVSNDQIGEAGRWHHSLPEHESLDFAEIQRAAESQDQRIFSQLVKAINWGNRQPSDLSQGIELALSMEMIPLARDLAERGRKLFPNNERIRRLAAVLTPAVILGSRPSQPHGLELSQQWIREYASSYKNQWIAVQEGKLLGVASTLRELHEKLGPGGKAPSIIIVKVLPNGTI